MIVFVPDEVAKKYMEKFPERNPNQIATAFAAILEKVINTYIKDGEPRLTLTADHLRKLTEVIGHPASSEDLVNRVRRLGTVKVQGRDFQLSQEQVVRLKQEAFFNRKTGEPDINEASPQEAEKIVQRYMDDQLKYWLNQMTSQI